MAPIFQIERKFYRCLGPNGADSATIQMLIGLLEANVGGRFAMLKSLDWVWFSKTVCWTLGQQFWKIDYQTKHFKEMQVNRTLGLSAWSFSLCQKQTYGTLQWSKRRCGHCTSCQQYDLLSQMSLQGWTFRLRRVFGALTSKFRRRQMTIVLTAYLNEADDADRFLSKQIMVELLPKFCRPDWKLRPQPSYGFWSKM